MNDIPTENLAHPEGLKTKGDGVDMESNSMLSESLPMPETKTETLPPRPRWPHNVTKGPIPPEWNKSLVLESSKPIGRPFKHNNPELLKKKGEAYFAQCDIDEKPYTITGLCLALGFCDRTQFFEYSKKIEFSNILKTLRMKCESYAEARLFNGPAAGPIFALKNYGWKDTSETTVTVKPPVLVDSLEAIDAEFEDITESQKEESPPLTSGDSVDN